MDRLKKIEKLLRKGLSTEEIGERLGISRQAVWLNMRRYKLDDNKRRLKDPSHRYYFQRRKVNG